jgi:hypothetical protein
MTTFSAQAPCTLRLSGEWRFVFTAEAQRGRGCAEKTVTIIHVLINSLIAQHVINKSPFLHGINIEKIFFAVRPVRSFYSPEG